MKVVLLHGADAAEPPEDPVLGQIEGTLAALGHEVVRVPVAADVEQVTAALRAADPALVFNLAESFDGKSALESNVAALLNLMGLRYTGSSPAGLMMAGDKSLTKMVLGFQKIPSPQFATIFRGALGHVGDLRFPLIVKPPQEDASLGITSKSVVRDIRELFSTMDSLQREFQSPVLVEEFVEGREFYVGVIGNVSPTALPVIELDFSAFPADRPKVASYEAKWGEGGTGGEGETGAEFAGTRSIFPADLDSELAIRMQEVAVSAFNALRLRDYGRVDLRVTDDGQIYVIEVNPNCYLERSGELARAAAKSGMDHEALVARIMELALARYAR
jgi:D-alanine-D-alanine ligase